MFRRRPSALKAVLTLLFSVIFLCLLFLPAKDEDNLRLALDWRPGVEPLLLIGFLAVVSLAGWRVPAIVRWLIAAVILLAALLQFFEAEVLRFFDRELNLYFDLPHTPKLVALFYDAAGAKRGLAAIAAVVLGSLLLLIATAHVLAAAERALKRPQHAGAYLGALAALLVAASALHFAAGETVISVRTSVALGRQVMGLYRAFVVMHGYDSRYAAALAVPQPALGKLPGLKHHDVYLIFFESYGTVILDDPRFAPTIAPALADFAGTVEKAGYHLLSSRIVSPTFGGGSWLAHGTVDSGLKLDPFLGRLIAHTQRNTLPHYMEAAGYRTIDVMPGLKTPTPETAFWGFDKSYYAADLGYHGPPFGWFDIPDQYTLRRFDETEGTPDHHPLFAQLVLVSSHIPFVPIPPYVEDWSDAGDYRSITPAQWASIYAPPDWSHLEAPYVASVAYDLHTLATWLARREGDALIIILGDHQPPGFISGEKQPWTVPIHVLSRDADLLRPFAALGYIAGAMPPREGEFKGMESFLGDFLTAFSRAVAAPPEAAEHVSD